MPKKKDILNASKVDTCGQCGSSKTHVIDVRTYNGKKQRRKECNNCKSRYGTIEILLTDFNLLKTNSITPHNSVLSLDRKIREKIHKDLTKRLTNIT